MLTEEELLFCVFYVESHDPRDAYRAAFSACAAFADDAVMPELAPEVVDERACALLLKPEITARLTELCDEAAETAFSLAQHLESLATIRDIALEAGDHNAAISAEFGRGWASGLYGDPEKAARWLLADWRPEEPAEPEPETAEAETEPSPMIN